MDITTGTWVLLIICLLLACAFEFVNGFHDTANAVATVIYTNTLKPTVAVVWSGLFNFAGVFAGGIGVAMGIVNLLPVEVLVDQDSSHGIAMIFALLLSAIIWNLGTWWYGLPASSSHALIGSILGIGVAFYFIPSSSGTAVNWGKAQEIGLSLLISPLFGFGCAIFLMYIFRSLIKNETIFKEPQPGKTPPIWIRAILITTCTGVSFFHGSNDGQKGVGLMMLILIGLVPIQFALKPDFDLNKTYASLTTVNEIILKTDSTHLSGKEKAKLSEVKDNLALILTSIQGKNTVNDVEKEQRFAVRKNILLITKGIEKLMKSENYLLAPADNLLLKENVDVIKGLTDYAPKWVIIMISLSLGLGTMVGWKRIVKTVGEKIGKQHMSYAQGASAEIVAATTIGLSTGLNMPVSTTHVLSSGIAGTMVAKKGLKNLQPQTIRNILMAWILTLPVTMVLSGGLFLLFRAIF